MSSHDDLISEAVSLPVEIRIRLVEELLESLNPTHQDIDELWAVESERRAAQIEGGEVETVPGDVVFERLLKKLKK
ncbi:MAG: addiction module protein [Syntrophobacteraceae bacterium]|jgi:putative addiction module component (TIGR02574 family)